MKYYGGWASGIHLPLWESLIVIVLFVGIVWLFYCVIGEDSYDTQREDTSGDYFGAVYRNSLAEERNRHIARNRELARRTGYANRKFASREKRRESQL